MRNRLASIRTPEKILQKQRDLIHLSLCSATPHVPTTIAEIFARYFNRTILHIYDDRTLSIEEHNQYGNWLQEHGPRLHDEINRLVEAKRLSGGPEKYWRPLFAPIQPAAYIRRHA